MDTRFRFSELPIGHTFEYEVKEEPIREGLMMKVGFIDGSPPRSTAVCLDGILVGELVRVGPDDVVVIKTGTP